MRKTNTITRYGTAAFILAAIGATTPILSTASAEPILNAPILTAPILTAPILTTVQDKMQQSLTLSDTPDTSDTPAIEKRAEAPKAEPKPEPAASVETQTPTTQTNFKPMRLRMNPQFTTEQLSKIESQRQAVANAQDDKILRTALDDTFFKISFKNRFEVVIDDAGQAHMEISLGQGGWPGSTVNNTKWLKREMSADMQRGLKDIIKTCSSATGPVYFNANMLEGDADIGKGSFEVECVPGSDIIRSQVTSLDLAHAYLASNDLPHAKRQGNFQWKYRFAKMADYVKNTPNATFAGDKAFCVNMLTELKEKYTFTENHRAQADEYLEQCPTTDYNWIRKRHGVPEITQ